jgi:hypothetical protein
MPSLNQIEHNRVMQSFVSGQAFLASASNGNATAKGLFDSLLAVIKHEEMEIPSRDEEEQGPSDIETEGQDQTACDAAPADLGDTPVSSASDQTEALPTDATPTADSGIQTKATPSATETETTNVPAMAETTEGANESDGTSDDEQKAADALASEVAALVALVSTAEVPQDQQPIQEPATEDVSDVTQPALKSDAKQADLAQLKEAVAALQTPAEPAPTQADAVNQTIEQPVVSEPVAVVSEELQNKPLTDEKDSGASLLDDLASEADLKKAASDKAQASALDVLAAKADKSDKADKADKLENLVKLLSDPKPSKTTDTAANNAASMAQAVAVVKAAAKDNGKSDSKAGTAKELTTLVTPNVDLSTKEEAQIPAKTAAAPASATKATEQNTPDIQTPSVQPPRPQTTDDSSQDQFHLVLQASKDANEGISSSNLPAGGSHAASFKAGAADFGLTTGFSARVATSVLPNATTHASTPQQSGNANIAQQVSLYIKSQVKSGEEELKIQLHPQDLGRVDVKLTITQDKTVQATVTADNQSTLDLLKQDQSQLQQALQDAGLQTNSNSLQFSLRDGDPQSGGQTDLGGLSSDQKENRLDAESSGGKAPEEVVVANYIITPTGVDITV